MRPRDLEDALSRCPGGRADAVFNVHLAGQTGDLAGLYTIARHHDLRIIEDGCHALGTRYSIGDGEEHVVGQCRYADATTFSFHPVKAIAMGEGGAITTNDPDLAAIMLRDRTHGMNRDAASFVQDDEAFDAGHAPNPWYYEMEAPGLNYRIPDVLCALGESQLRKLEAFSARRRALVALYDEVLGGRSAHLSLLARTPHVTAAWHLYVVLIDFVALGVSRAEVMRRLAAEGIGTQVHYLPVHRQPYYRDMSPAGALPGADKYYARTLSLPLFPGMENGDVERVSSTLLRVLGL
jgi:dTDP-4-amino-4,6-dideoxygalactose transaminase